MFVAEVKQKLKNARRKIFRKLLINDNFSIISDNCWGGFMYQYFGIEYKSPFVGLYIFSPDYIRLITDFKYYMSLDLLFIEPKCSKYSKYMVINNTYGTYPIGIIGDVEIHFLHYSCENEALNKWNRRKERINYQKLIIKFSDRDVFGLTHLGRFDKIKDKKVFISSLNFKLNYIKKVDKYDNSEWYAFLKVSHPLFFINNILKNK